jgi:hypothetical protein
MPHPGATNAPRWLIEDAVAAYPSTIWNIDKAPRHLPRGRGQGEGRAREGRLTSCGQNVDKKAGRIEKGVQYGNPEQETTSLVESAQPTQRDERQPRACASTREVVMNCQ